MHYGYWGSQRISLIMKIHALNFVFQVHKMYAFCIFFR